MAEVQICRTCLGLIRKPSVCVSLEGIGTKSEEIKSKLEACVPEMTIGSVKNPVICGRCLILLNASHEFKRKCIATETEICDYLFNSEDDLVDLKFLVNNTSIDLTIEEDEEEIQSIPPVKNNCKIEINDGQLLSIKSEEFCDFEATETFLSFNTSEHFYDEENLNPRDRENEVMDENKSETNSLPNSSVALTPLSDSSNSLETNVNVDKDLDLSKNSKRQESEKKTPRKYKRFDECYVYYPYNSSTAEPMEIRTRPKLDSSEKRHHCGICGYNTSMKLNTHMRIHTGEKPYKCDICGYASAYTTCLISHMKMHEKKKIERCGYCKFRTKSVVELKDHMKNHPGCKMYKCNKCEYSTDILKHINYHKLTHSKKEIYECATCPFKTIQKRLLIQHVRIHLTDKSFRCNICIFSAIYQEDLNKHLEIHGGEL